MSIAKNKRVSKRQLGQFLTPPGLARDLVKDIRFCAGDKVLEPSMGDGSFVIPVIEKFMALHTGSVAERLGKTLSANVYGVEIDRILYDNCLSAIRQKWGMLPECHNFICGDFLLSDFRSRDGRRVAFDYVIGNPPFGGTIDEAHQDALDRQLGFRGGVKIKKETYSFFIVKSAELLRRDGRLVFICSDTFMTIKTMKGLRNFLLGTGDVEINAIPFFSGEVSQKTVLLKYAKGGGRGCLTVDGAAVKENEINATPNHSWRISPEWVKYFRGGAIGDIMTASSGMTVGKNDYFIRKITGGKITEPFAFSFFRRPVTLADELTKARLRRLSPAKAAMAEQMERAGETVRDVKIAKREHPLTITVPHPDYCYYNKASKHLFYAPPEHAIFWRDDGDAVYTFKNNGNWYLRGVGGKKYFFREGLTWNLVSSRLRARYLPAGYVLDSGAPCAFLNPAADRDELFFMLAWSASDLCNQILKRVINHTKNIQGKDFERLPYPFWVSPENKAAAVGIVKSIIEDAMSGALTTSNDSRLPLLNGIFSDDSYFNHRHSPPKENIVMEPNTNRALAGII